MTTTRRGGEYPLPEHGRTAYCKSCGASIVWIKTEAGRPLPLDLRTAETRCGVRYALNHFSTCPEGRHWSHHGAHDMAAQEAPASPWARHVADLAARYRLADGTLPATWWLLGRRNLSEPMVSEDEIASDAARVAAQQSIEEEDV